MEEITVKSVMDGSLEKNLFHCPQTTAQVPMVVGLHSWSYGRSNQIDYMLPFCEKRKWALLLPEFRGPNTPGNPRAFEACGSRIARQDIVDAVKHVVKNYPVDANKIFLLGGSGGGHMALLTGAYEPEIWLAVSAWSSITDLGLWHRQCKDEYYIRCIEACCGKASENCFEIDWEYIERSPLSHTEALMRVRNLFLGHGASDTLVSPVHSKMLANLLMLKQHPAFFYEIFNGGHHLQYSKAFIYLDELLVNEAGAQNKLTG